MRKSKFRVSRLLAVFFSLALVAAACGDGEDTTATTDSSGTTAAPSNMADDSMSPVKIGLIAQDEELFAFPEVRAVAQAFVDYFNAEEKGIDGHPIELDVCGAGDAPDSHVACAQQFVNDDDIHVVINAGFGGNSAASNPVLAEGGKATMTLGNDFSDYLTPGVFTFDPGLLGLAQVFFVYAADTRGVESATMFIADDPSLEPFIPVLELIASDNGITINEVIPLGFEPDLTMPG
jgi:branched-chain amino acid transport system substrate-binding protein